ncbi:sigma-70 family RNA polymerase sigma factor [Kribbella kalugense]|uniref:RNA polymerase sigma-70 factor (ECF subfamily) n=1 Tax=Kribbella kalugense TaxID=2512221 RepID=A0A4R7ZY92_9ACTN|nr:sigma-70 family RNA polymerase sigma factor [Kribbella kalugense]TDW22716.1 RNA polymerase sigma-70 factor (ECF subfamily) [Kribbella kalugense]
MTRDELTEAFEAERSKLEAVAFRLLGSHSEAEDAVQEAWIRLGRTEGIDNLGAWLRTVVTRICLDVLRSRKVRPEDATTPDDLEQTPAIRRTPEDEALVADSVSRALLVVLDTLEPAERIAFVLHDMFAVPFAQIAPIVERTPVATKKLASRARQRVQGAPVVPSAELARQRRVVSAFLHAAQAGDLAAVLAVLAPDVVRRVDATALAPGMSAELRGAQAVAEGTVVLSGRSQLAELALVNGEVGLVLAPQGRLLLAITFTSEADRITSYDVVADPDRLAGLRLAVLSPISVVR